MREVCMYLDDDHDDHDDDDHNNNNNSNKNNNNSNKNRDNNNNNNQRYCWSSCDLCACLCENKAHSKCKSRTLCNNYFVQSIFRKMRLYRENLNGFNITKASPNKAPVPGQRHSLSRVDRWVRAKKNMEIIHAIKTTRHANAKPSCNVKKNASQNMQQRQQQK